MLICTQVQSSSFTTHTKEEITTMAKTIQMAKKNTRLYPVSTYALLAIFASLSLMYGVSSIQQRSVDLASKGTIPDPTLFSWVHIAVPLLFSLTLLAIIVLKIELKNKKNRDKYNISKR